MVRNVLKNQLILWIFVLFVIVNFVGRVRWRVYGNGKATFVAIMQERFLCLKKRENVRGKHVFSPHFSNKKKITVVRVSCTVFNRKAFTVPSAVVYSIDSM